MTRKYVPPEEERDISDHSIGDNQVERISYTKVNILSNGVHYILSLFLTERIDGTKSCETPQQRPAELTDKILK